MALSIVVSQLALLLCAACSVDAAIPDVYSADSAVTGLEDLLAPPDAGVRSDLADGGPPDLLARPDGKVLFHAQQLDFQPVGMKAPGGGAVLIAADFDGDGFTDLATVDNPPRIVNAMVTVTMNNHDLTFRTTFWQQVPRGGIHGESGDFDGDGRLDFVFSSVVEMGAIPYVFYSLGKGTFLARQTMVAGWFAAADLNRDGLADIAQARIGHLESLLAKPDRTFTFSSIGDAGQMVTSGTAVGDFNGDGRGDVITGALGPQQGGIPGFSFFAGDGTGQFSKPIFHLWATAAWPGPYLVPARTAAWMSPTGSIPHSVAATAASTTDRRSILIRISLR